MLSLSFQLSVFCNVMQCATDTCSPHWEKPDFKLEYRNTESSFKMIVDKHTYLGGDWWYHYHSLVVSLHACVRAHGLKLQHAHNIKSRVRYRSLFNCNISLSLSLSHTHKHSLSLSFSLQTRRNMANQRE
jgi:hypothetical protein